MDPIRPIGPPERDVEPIVRVNRASRDGNRDRPDRREGGQPRQPQREPPPPDDEDGTSLIDVRV
jgi:hypothetical protein